MKRHAVDFFKRGLIAMGSGPVVLAIVYWFLWKNGIVEMISAAEMIRGILTVSLLAFLAGGINVVYSMERLPLAYAILIHGVVLYIDYAVIYLVNGWLASGRVAFLIFTAIFVGGYFLVWSVIFAVTKIGVERMNRKIRQGSSKS